MRLYCIVYDGENIVLCDGLLEAAAKQRFVHAIRSCSGQRAEIDAEAFAGVFDPCLLRGPELQEAQADLKMQAVRDMDKIVLLLDERYYYDEEGYLRAACFMKNGSSYVRKIFHRLNHAKESIALVVKNNEKVYNTLLDLL